MWKGIIPFQLVHVFWHLSWVFCLIVAKAFCSLNKRTSRLPTHSQSVPGFNPQHTNKAAKVAQNKLPIQTRYSKRYSKVRAVAASFTPSSLKKTRGGKVRAAAAMAQQWWLFRRIYCCWTIPSGSSMLSQQWIIQIQILLACGKEDSDQLRFFGSRAQPTHSKQANARGRRAHRPCIATLFAFAFELLFAAGAWAHSCASKI
jgi:hypothetical protein